MLANEAPFFVRNAFGLQRLDGVVVGQLEDCVAVDRLLDRWMFGFHMYVVH
jgi:hypothetical protein